MKNFTVLIIALLLSVNVYSEKLESYKASNGKTYKIGDEIRIGRGSGHNGQFVYLEMGGWLAVAGASNGQSVPVLGKEFTGRTVVVEKIKKQNSGKVLFIVKSKNITNYTLYIDDAIATCEIEDCKKDAIPVTVINQTSKFDELKKLKELFDAGAITEQEYQTEKEKLLK